MAKRIVITGLPCPIDPWQSLLGSSSDDRFLPLSECLERTESNDLRQISSYVAKEISKFQPESIIAHGFGVSLTLVALLKLSRKGALPDAKLTLFNGAFRKLDIFKVSHPFKVQVMPYEFAVREVVSNGGQIDPRLKPYYPRIKAIYRNIIADSLAEKAQQLFGLDNLSPFSARALLKMPIQIIASENDPYTPFESMEQLRRDLAPQRMVRIDYGHFPYSLEPQVIRSLVEEFETENFSGPNTTQSVQNRTRKVSHLGLELSPKI